MLAVCLLGLLVALGGCASDDETTGIASIDEANDPLETVNRFTFAINQTLDTFILRPVAVTYRQWVPEGARNSVQSFSRHLLTPVTLANDLMQGETRRAEATLARFFINTLIGVGGLIDVASDFGWDYHEEDFGQTLAVWGVDEGPYLVLPIFGPSNIRDATGRLVDVFLDPFIYADSGTVARKIALGAFIGGGVDQRARVIEPLDALERDSLDFYARVRSLYSQQRKLAIDNASAGDTVSGTPGADYENLFDLDDEEELLTE